MCFSDLEEKWQILKDTMELLGYKMVDLHEHQFIKNVFEIGFAFTEDLLQFADVNYKKLKVIEDKGVKYHILTISDFLKVY